MNLNDCNDSKIGRSLISLSVVLGGRSFYHDTVLRNPAVDSVTFDSIEFLTDSRLRSEVLLKFEGYNDVQITTLFLNWLPTVT